MKKFYIKKKISGNKILYKGKYNNEIFLTEKNINDNLKGSFYHNDINNKKISSVLIKGYNISKSNIGLENMDNNSFKIVRKLDLEEESKKDEDYTFIDLNKNKNIKKIMEIKKAKKIQ